jgi:hypothetical protein
MGLDDQTALVADVTPGQSYSGSITWGTCGGNYGNSGTIWIDWNQNSTFDPAEVVHTFDGTPIVTEAINFTVPMDATPGATTMRVKQQETSSTPPLDPCGSFLWGGVVDFSISVTDPCPPAENISIDNISDVSANVNFDANGENVNVEITAAGAGQGNGTMTNDVTSPYTFTGLTASTDYDVYVQRACANGFQSAWDGPHSFSTFSTCGTPNANISNISDVSADINFTTPNGEPVNIEVTAAGAGQGNNVIISMNGLTSGPFTFNGLAESTSYDVYIQTDCGTNLSSVVGPISFTTLKTPVISLTDSSGDGFPNISDPCDCNDSDNIVDAGTNVVTWFHDYVTINSNPGETWTITNYTGGQMYSAPGVAIPTGTALTEVFPGFYRIDFLHENGTGFEAQFNRSVNPLAAPMMIGNSCDGVFCSMEAVPTMGEWSMIIFALIMLSFGVVYVMRQQVALAGFETANTSAFNQRVPFEKGIFRTILAYVMIGLAVTFAVAVTMFGYEMTNADIPGSLIAGPMLAYFIHLLVMSSKEKEA